MKRLKFICCIILACSAVLTASFLMTPRLRLASIDSDIICERNIGRCSALFKSPVFGTFFGLKKSEIFECTGRLENEKPLINDIASTRQAAFSNGLALIKNDGGIYFTKDCLEVERIGQTDNFSYIIYTDVIPGERLLSVLLKRDGRIHLEVWNIEEKKMCFETRISFEYPKATVFLSPTSIGVFGYGEKILIVDIIESKESIVSVKEAEFSAKKIIYLDSNFTVFGVVPGGGCNFFMLKAYSLESPITIKLNAVPTACRVDHSGRFVVLATELNRKSNRSYVYLLNRLNNELKIGGSFKQESILDIEFLSDCDLLTAHDDGFVVRSLLKFID